MWSLHCCIQSLPLRVAIMVLEQVIMLFLIQLVSTLYMYYVKSTHLRKYAHEWIHFWYAVVCCICTCTWRCIYVKLVILSDELMMYMYIECVHTGILCYIILLPNSRSEPSPFLWYHFHLWNLIHPYKHTLLAVFSPRHVRIMYRISVNMEP